MLVESVHIQREPVAKHLEVNSDIVLHRLFPSQILIGESAFIVPRRVVLGVFPEVGDIFLAFVVGLDVGETRRTDVVVAGESGGSADLEEINSPETLHPVLAAENPSEGDGREEPEALSGREGLGSVVAEIRVQKIAAAVGVGDSGGDSTVAVVYIAALALVLKVTEKHSGHIVLFTDTELAFPIQLALEPVGRDGRVVGKRAGIVVIDCPGVGGLEYSVLRPVSGVVFPHIHAFSLEFPRGVAREGQISKGEGVDLVSLGGSVVLIVGELSLKRQAFGDERKVLAKTDGAVDVVVCTDCVAGVAELSEDIVAVHLVIAVKKLSSVVGEIELILLYPCVFDDDREVRRLGVGESDERRGGGSGVGCLAHPYSQIDSDREALCGLHINVGAEVETGESVLFLRSMVGVVVTLVVIASEDEILNLFGSSPYGQGVILHYRRFEHVVEVVPIVAEPVRVVALCLAVVGDRLAREEGQRVDIDPRIVVHESLVVEYGIVRGTKVTWEFRRLRHSDGCLEINCRLFALTSALGGDDDHSVGSSDSVRRCG